MTKFSSFRSKFRKESNSVRAKVNRVAESSSQKKPKLYWSASRDEKIV